MVLLKSALAPMARVVACAVADERESADGSVRGAGHIVKECFKTVGRIAAAGGVAQKERTSTTGCVEVSGDVVQEREGSVSRVGFPSGVAQ